MDYLHSLESPLINSNLKSSNVLLSNKVISQGLAKACLSDYCLGKRYLDEGVRWAAPEFLNSNISNAKSDVYSFGIIMWEVFSRKRPFYHLTQEKVIEAISVKKERPSMLDVEKHVLKELPELIEMTKKCWCENPEHRPSFSDILCQIRVTMKKKNLI
jgi:mitogen-activated protein kinase kinase kinase 7